MSNLVLRLCAWPHVTTFSNMSNPAVSGLSNNDLRLTGEGSVEYKPLIFRFIFESGMTPHFASAMGKLHVRSLGAAHWALLTNLFHLTASETGDDRELINKLDSRSDSCAGH
jgi:hypothetical protein